MVQPAGMLTGSGLMAVIMALRHGLGMQNLRGAAIGYSQQNWALRTVLSGARLAGLQTTIVSGMCRCASPSRLILAGAQLSELFLPSFGR